MNFRVSGKIPFVWQHWKKFGVDRAEITFPKKKFFYFDNQIYLVIPIISLLFWHSNKKCRKMASLLLCPTNIVQVYILKVESF